MEDSRYGIVGQGAVGAWAHGKSNSLSGGRDIESLVASLADEGRLVEGAWVVDSRAIADSDAFIHEVFHGPMVAGLDVEDEGIDRFQVPDDRLGAFVVSEISSVFGLGGLMVEQASVKAEPGPFDTIPPKLYAQRHRAIGSRIGRWYSESGLTWEA